MPCPVPFFRILANSSKFIANTIRYNRNPARRISPQRLSGRSSPVEEIIPLELGKDAILRCRQACHSGMRQIDEEDEEDTRMRA